jgi:hypothetical protein
VTRLFDERPRLAILSALAALALVVVMILITSSVTGAAGDEQRAERAEPPTHWMTAGATRPGPPSRTARRRSCGARSGAPSGGHRPPRAVPASDLVPSGAGERGRCAPKVGRRP